MTEEAQKKPFVLIIVILAVFFTFYSMNPFQFFYSTDTKISQFDSIKLTQIESDFNQGSYNVKRCDEDFQDQCSESEQKNWDLALKYKKVCDDNTLKEDSEYFECEDEALYGEIENLIEPNPQKLDHDDAVDSPSDDSSVVSTTVEKVKEVFKPVEVKETGSFLEKNTDIVKKFGIFERHGSIVPKRVILHHTGGSTLASAEAAMKNHNDELGIHFMIDKDGTTYMYGNLNDKFYHAGPANGDSIGIEIVNSGIEDYTDAQYTSIRNLLEELSIEVKDKKEPFVIGHFEVRDLYGSGTAGKWDPSPNFDWSEIGYSRSDQRIATLCNKVLSDSKINFNLDCYFSNIG